MNPDITWPVANVRQNTTESSQKSLYNEAGPRLSTLIKWLSEWITWWRHQMENFPHYWPFVRGIHRSPMNSPHKSQWLGAMVFSLICAWINGWVNTREAGDLRRHRAHYDVSVMRRIKSHQTSRDFLRTGIIIICRGHRFIYYKILDLNILLYIWRKWVVHSSFSRNGQSTRSLLVAEKGKELLLLY